MVSERLLQLSQPLERRLNEKYEHLKMKNDSLIIGNKNSKQSSCYDRLISLAEPRHRREKYVNPENSYNNNSKFKNYNNKKQNSDEFFNAPSSSFVTPVNNMKYFNKLMKPIKNCNTYEKNLLNVDTKTSKMEESDQVTRMSRKTYVTVPYNEGKTPKQLAKERLEDLATPRYRREKYVDPNIQYDVTYQSQSLKKLSQMSKQSTSSSLSTSPHRYGLNKEVLQLAEGIQTINITSKNAEISEMIIPKYLRKQTQINSDPMRKVFNSKQVKNHDNINVFDEPFIRSPSEIRFLKKQITLSNKFKTKVSPIKKLPTTILWHSSKPTWKRRRLSKKLSNFI